MALGGTLKEFQLISRTVVQDIPHGGAHFMARNQQLSIEPLVPTSRDEWKDDTIWPCRMIRTSTTALTDRRQALRREGQHP
jgi:hypothetical protein